MYDNNALRPIESDAEISFCGAIEIAGTITLKTSVMKNGMKELSSPSPIYIAGNVEPNYSPGRFITFEGFSVDETGKQHYMDATVSYRQTVLRCIAYLKRYGGSTCPLVLGKPVWLIHLAGYDDYQCYLLLSCVPVQAHIAGIVDVRYLQFSLLTMSANRQCMQIPNCCT